MLSLVGGWPGEAFLAKQGIGLIGRARPYDRQDVFSKPTKNNKAYDLYYRRAGLSGLGFFTDQISRVRSGRVG